MKDLKSKPALDDQSGVELLEEIEVESFTFGDPLRENDSPQNIVTFHNTCVYCGNPNTTFCA